MKSKLKKSTLGNFKKEVGDKLGGILQMAAHKLIPIYLGGADVEIRPVKSGCALVLVDEFREVAPSYDPLKTRKLSGLISEFMEWVDFIDDKNEKAETCKLIAEDLIKQANRLLRKRKQVLVGMRIDEDD